MPISSPLEMSFPRESTKKIQIVICATQGLASAKRDAYALTTVMQRLGFRTFILIDSNSDIAWLKQKFGKNDKIRYMDSMTQVGQIFNFIKKRKEPYDIFVSISGHGFLGAGSSYFIFAGQTIDKNVMRPWYVGLENTKHHVFTLIDTCHSGNMVGFQKINPREFRGLGESQLWTPMALAGCSATQSLMQDISTEFGYGGGLTSAFLDAIGEGPFDLNAVASQCCARLLHLGCHSVLSSAEGRVKPAHVSDDYITYNAEYQRFHEHYSKKLKGIKYILTAGLSFFFITLAVKFGYVILPLVFLLGYIINFSNILLSEKFIQFLMFFNFRPFTYIATELCEINLFFNGTQNVSQSLVQQRQLEQGQKSVLEQTYFSDS